MDYDAMIWTPSIFMPRSASRITLEVVSVRVERLQDITEEDAKAEGVSGLPLAMMKVWPPTGPSQGVPMPMKDVFAALWDSLNAKRGFGWQTNPWVFVIEFQRIKP